jgi:hypothetical protein
LPLKFPIKIGVFKHNFFEKNRSKKLPFVLGRVKKAQMMVVLLPLVDAKKRTDKKIHTISDGLLVNHL